jgi:2-polyprenyl-6-methoxyphenol hydroxylase-like FAD-dependent oxidoreductase
MERTEVLVVGAGPTGLALAATLAARGVDHLLVDRAPDGAGTSRAAVVHAATLAALESIGAAGTLVERGVKVDRFAIRDRDRRLLGVPFDSLPGRYPYTLMAPQDVTEQVLRERLTQLGGSVGWGRELTAVTPDGTATVGGETIRARWVVGCDGMNSRVREHAGIEFAGSAYPQSFVLADVTLDWPLSRREVQLFFSPQGLVVVAPLPADRFRIVATTSHAPARPDAGDVQALLDARGPVRERARVTGLVWSSRFTVHRRVAGTYRRGAVLLAGDAAHVHSPAGGQGMNLGIRDAIALGARLATGDLSGYEERRQLAVDVVANTDRLTKAATTVSPPRRIIRNMLLRTLDHVPAARRRAALDLAGLHDQG